MVLAAPALVDFFVPVVREGDLHENLVQFHSDSIYALLA